MSPGRVLFVCTGNLCRSPMAEGLARHHAGLRGLAIEFASAGLIARDGESPSENGVSVLAARGVDIGAQRARRLRGEHIADADLVVALDEEHRLAVREFPEAALKPVLTGEMTNAVLDSEQELTNVVVHPEHAPTIVDLEPPVLVQQAIQAAAAPDPVPEAPKTAAPSPAPVPPAPQPVAPAPVQVVRTPPDPPWTAELNTRRGRVRGRRGQSGAAPKPRRWLRNLALVGVGAALVAAALLYY